MKPTPEQIKEQHKFANDVNALVRCREITEKALTAFVERYGYAPTKIWTPLQPERFITGELWIGGAQIRERTIWFPRTMVYPRVAGK